MDTVLLFTLELEQPLKLSVTSTGTLNSCFFRLNDFISKGPKLLESNFVLHNNDNNYRDDKLATAKIEC